MLLDKILVKRERREMKLELLLCKNFLMKDMKGMVWVLGWKFVLYWEMEVVGLLFRNFEDFVIFRMFKL